MSFNQKIAKAYSSGATVAFAAPLASFRGSAIALTGITAGSVVSAAGLVVSCGSPQFAIEWSSLSAVVQTGLTTTTLTAQTLWQVSEDGINWLNLLSLNGAANVTAAAAGTGALVTTNYVQAASGINPSFPYMRLAVLVGVVTGGAGDNVTVAYNYRKRTAL